MGLQPQVLLAQGASALKQDELLGIKSDQRWHGSLSLSSAKNQDQFSNGFMTSRAQLSYDLLSDTEFYADLIYRRPYTNVEEDVRQYGFDDFTLGFSKTLFTNQYENGVSFSTSGFLEGTLPTAETSRKASLYGATSLGAITNTVWKRIIFSTSHGFTLNFYEYETSDTFGSSYNDAYMINNGASLTWRITNQINWTNAYTLYYLKNYANTENYIQAYANSLSYIVDHNFTVSAFFSWKDRIKTNNALFDDDNTYLGAGIRYVF